MSDPSTTQRRAADRRASRRRPPRSLIRLECRKGSYGLGRNIAKQFLDLSETGVRLVVSAELQTGQEVEVLLHGTGLGRAVKRLARVVWVVKAGEESYCAGLHFDKPLDYASVQQISTPPTTLR